MQFAEMHVYYNIGNIYCMFVCVLDAFVVCLSAVAVECYYFLYMAGVLLVNTCMVCHNV